jgi:molybdenum ABC transporter molybdate-binding protein
LKSLDLWAELQDKLVMGQNIGQTHSLVATGAAELGFVALSAVMSPRSPTEGSYWEVPQELFSAIRQDAILLQPGADNPAATAFLEFLMSPKRPRSSRPTATRWPAMTLPELGPLWLTLHLALVTTVVLLV